MEQSLTPVTSRKIEPKMGSVFHRGVSPVHNFRSRMSTVNGPVFPLSEPNDAYEEAELKETMEEEGCLSAELMARLKAAEDNVTHEFATEDNREEREVRQSAFPSGDFHYFSSTRQQAQGDISGTASFIEQARTHPLSRPNNPSLQSNNGVSPFGQGDVNGERGVADCTPSSGNSFVEGEVEVERAIPAAWGVPIPEVSGFVFVKGANLFLCNETLQFANRNGSRRGRRTKSIAEGCQCLHQH